MIDFYTHRTVRWEDETVVMIDQRKLPQHVSYLECRDYNQVAEAIKTMAVRGAPAIGVAAAMGLGLAAHTCKAKSREELINYLEMAGEVLRKTRPTAVNLFWAIKRVLDVASSTVGDTEDIRVAVIKETQRMADEDISINRRMGKYGASLIEDGDTVLTHCK